MRIAQNRLTWMLLLLGLVGCGFGSQPGEQDPASPAGSEQAASAAPATQPDSNPSPQPPQPPPPKKAVKKQAPPVDPKMRAIYNALKITDARTNAESYSVGDEVTITYNITNVSSDDLPIPIKTSYSKPRHVAGIKQCYIERQGSDSTIPAISKRIKRDGRKYAAGGTVIFTEPVFAAGEKISFKNKVATAGYPAGKYTFDICYLQEGGAVIETVSIEFELKKPADQ